MKIIQYLLNDEAELGVLTKDETAVIRIADIIPDLEYADMTELIYAWDEATRDALQAAADADLQVVSVEEDIEVPAGSDAGEAIAEVTAIPLAEVEVISPIDHPVHDILCAGVNYMDHRAEAAASDISTPNVKDLEKIKTTYFIKRADRVMGPGEAVEGHFTVDPEFDYEVELAVIIGKRGKNIKREDAEGYIFGYSVMNDYSSRTIQRENDQWFRAKSLDTYTAMGPCIVTKESIPYPPEVEVICSVNGEERQHSNTRLLIKDVGAIIEELSEGMTLVPGDIISTGTPAGVVLGMKDPVWLKDGDVVRCEIPEIGVLENPVIAAKD